MAWISAGELPTSEIPVAAAADERWPRRQRVLAPPPTLTRGLRVLGIHVGSPSRQKVSHWAFSPKSSLNKMFGTLSCPPDAQNRLTLPS